MSQAKPKATPATSDDAALEQFPYFEEGKVPQYHRYHAEVSYLDELELIWGKRWGAQGIGQLGRVVIRKTAVLGVVDRFIDRGPELLNPCVGEQSAQTHDAVFPVLADLFFADVTSQSGDHRCVLCCRFSFCPDRPGPDRARRQ